MKLLKIDQIKGDEILARSIMTDDFHELLSEGAKLKVEYIAKLQDLGVTEVYVKDEEVDATTLEILKKEVNVKCREKVKDLISRHTYHNSKGMEEITNTADNIITNILEEEDVVEQIYDIKERSADLYEHSINTCTLATMVSLKLQLSKEMVHDISVGCLLHDLGLRYVTVDFDNIAIEDLQPKEMEEYKKHPVYAYSALKGEDWLSKHSKEIILCHHERMDGSGYPLKAKELTWGIKIAAVCDFFDEHICGIGCMRMKVYEVVEYLKSYKGKLFDERVVDALLDFTAVYPSGSKVLTSEGEVGIVIKQNKNFPERPVIQIVERKDGTILDKAEIKDLLQYNNVVIEKVLN